MFNLSSKFHFAVMFWRLASGWYLCVCTVTTPCCAVWGGRSQCFVVHVRCRRKESPRSLSHLLMSFLYFRGETTNKVLRGAWSQLYQTWRGYRAIMATQEVCFRVRISSCIFERERLKVVLVASDVEHDAKLRTFWSPPLWKLGRVGEIFTLYLRPNLRNTFDDHPLRGS